MKLDARQKMVIFYGGAALIGVGVVAWILGKFGKLANINEGTAYEGAGVVGTIGNVTNQVSGGTLGVLGEAIGQNLFDLTHEDYNAGVYFAVSFEDTGERHAVNSEDVNRTTGHFRYRGVEYILKKKADGSRVAVRA